MRAAELRSKTVEELNETLKKLRADFESIVNELLKGKEKNVKKAAAVKRDIARVQTVINEKKFLNAEVK